MSDHETYLIVRGIDRGERNAPTTDGYCGIDKSVLFHKGFGVLDLLALHFDHPDWVKDRAGFNEEPNLVQVAGETVGDRVRYFRRRGFNVIEINASDAAALRGEITVARAAQEKFLRAANDLYATCRTFVVDSTTERAL